ncbi:hypothetical protein BDV3_003705 [Batrachochytrium dendrobatidis]
MVHHPTPSHSRTDLSPAAIIHMYYNLATTDCINLLAQNEQYLRTSSNSFHYQTLQQLGLNIADLLSAVKEHIDQALQALPSLTDSHSSWKVCMEQVRQHHQELVQLIRSIPNNPPLINHDKSSLPKKQSRVDVESVEIYQHINSVLQMLITNISQFQILCSSDISSHGLDTMSAYIANESCNAESEPYSNDPVAIIPQYSCNESLNHAMMSGMSSIQSYGVIGPGNSNYMQANNLESLSQLDNHTSLTAQQYLSEIITPDLLQSINQMHTSPESTLPGMNDSSENVISCINSALYCLQSIIELSSQPFDASQRKDLYDLAYNAMLHITKLLSHYHIESSFSAETTQRISQDLQVAKIEVQEKSALMQRIYNQNVKLRDRCSEVLEKSKHHKSKGKELLVATKHATEYANDVNARYKQLDITIKKTNDANSALKIENEQFKKEAAIANQKIQELMNEKVAAEQASRELSNEKAATKQKLEQLTHEKATLDLQTRELQEKIAFLHKEMDKAQKSFDCDLVSCISKMEQKCKNLDSNIQTLQKENVAANAKIAALLKPQCDCVLKHEPIGLFDNTLLSASFTQATDSQKKMQSFKPGRPLPTIPYSTTTSDSINKLDLSRSDKLSIQLASQNNQTGQFFKNCNIFNYRDLPWDSIENALSAHKVYCSLLSRPIQIYSVYPAILRRFKNRHITATIIQSHWRGYKNRKQFYKHRNRLFVCGELVENEASYLQHLFILIKSALPIKEILKSGQKGALSRTRFCSILHSIEAIANVTATILYKILKRLDVWHVNQTVGDVFLRMVPHLMSYKAYIEQYSEVLKYYGLLGNGSSLKSNSHHELLDLLITPVQHIPRYVLLLKELIKNTSTHHPDRHLIQKACDQLHQLVLQIDGNSIENMEFILSDFPQSLEQNKRSLLYSISLDENTQTIEKVANEFRMVNRVLLVYSDLIIGADVMPSKNSTLKQLRFQWGLALSDVTAIEYNPAVLNDKKHNLGAMCISWRCDERSGTYCIPYINSQMGLSWTLKIQSTWKNASKFPGMTNKLGLISRSLVDTTGENIRNTPFNLLGDAFGQINIQDDQIKC